MSIRHAIKRAVPLSILTKYRQAKFLFLDWAEVPRLSHDLRSSQSVFKKIYDGREWGSKNTVSGPGSEIGELRTYVNYFRRCCAGWKSGRFWISRGDFLWMSRLNLSSYDYTGADVVPALIETPVIENCTATDGHRRMGNT